MRTNYRDWNHSLKLFVAALPIGTPKQCTAETLAKETGLTPSSINSLRIILQHIGALDMRFERVTMDPQSGKRGRQLGGKHTILTLLFGYEEIQKEMKRLGLTFGHDTVKMISKGKKKPEPVAPPVRVEDSPFEVLRPMLKDEPKALIEAARQYAGRREFLAEKVEEFARHGLSLDLAAIGAPVDERLDHIALVLPYVNALEKANSRLSVAHPSSVTEINGLKAKNQDLELRLEEARRHLAEARKERELLRTDGERREGNLKGRIRELEEQIAAFRRQPLQK